MNSQTNEPVAEKSQRVLFTSKSWVLLGALQGVTGGVVAALLYLVWSLVNGEWMDALLSPLSVFGAVVTSFITALLGYPVYRWLATRKPSITVVAGAFGDHPNETPAA